MWCHRRISIVPPTADHGKIPVNVIFHIAPAIGTVPEKIPFIRQFNGALFAWLKCFLQHNFDIIHLDPFPAFYAHNVLLIGQGRIILILHAFNREQAVEEDGDMRYGHVCLIG
jgi:hypothetical protein